MVNPEHGGLVRVDRADDVAIIVLDRPDRLNALSHDLLIELRAAIASVTGGEVRAVVLTGAGRAFSAGADLRGAPRDADDVLRTFYNPLILDLLQLDKPTIAAVNGPAVGAGVSLTLACDLRIAAESATFQMAFAKVGFIPDAGSSWLLPRIVGSGRAAEMALSGRAVDAPEALAWGLVNQMVPDGQAITSAVERALSLAALPRTALSTRTLLIEGWSSGLRDHLEAEAVAQRHAQSAPEHAEARLAFAQKRRPNFTNV